MSPVTNHEVYARQRSLWNDVRSEVGREFDALDEWDKITVKRLIDELSFKQQDFQKLQADVQAARDELESLKAEDDRTMRRTLVALAQTLYGAKHTEAADAVIELLKISDIVPPFVLGDTSFLLEDDGWRVDGVKYPSFAAACKAHNLVPTDDQLARAVLYQRP